MGNSIQNALGILPALFSLRRYISRQRRFMRKEITPILDVARATNDGSLSERDFKKINRYYGLAVPAILGEAFCRLRGNPMEENERWASTSQGVITGLFDDFFDGKKLPQSQILAMLKNPETIEANDSNESLFLTFGIKVLQFVKNADWLRTQFMLVHKAQVESLKQENAILNSEDLWLITRNKGGHSVLFYRAAFNNPMRAGEEAALYQLGSLMQLENDIFDVYKDVKSNICTLMTSETNMADLRKRFMLEAEKMLDLCHHLDYPKNQIIDFLDIIMPVVNRGFVALDQYEKLQLSTGGIFEPSKYSRKQLICDMETPKHILKTIGYQIKNHY